MNKKGGRIKLGAHFSLPEPGKLPIFDDDHVKQVVAIRWFKVLWMTFFML